MNKLLNKITSLSLIVAATAFAASCSDDDAGEEYTRANSVSIQSAELTFDADAATGGVKFTAPAGATATTNVDWATATLSGDSVVVSVTDNTALESRSGELTIHSGADSTNVPILQLGCKFTYTGSKKIIVHDNDTTINLPFTRKGAALTIAASDSSVVGTAVQGKDNYSLPITANTTGDIRGTQIYISHAGIVDTINVVQGDRSDVIGKSYYLAGLELSGEQAEREVLPGTIYEDEGENGPELYFYIPRRYTGLSNFFIPIEFDESTLTFSVSGNGYSGSYTYQNTNYYFLTSIIDISAFRYINTLAQTGNSYFWVFESEYLSMDAELSVSDEGADGTYVYGAFENNADNDVYAQYLYSHGLSGFPTTYNAQVLGLDMNTLGTDGYFEYQGPLMLLGVPQLLHELTPAQEAKIVTPAQIRQKIKNAINGQKHSAIKAGKNIGNVKQPKALLRHLPNL